MEELVIVEMLRSGLALVTLNRPDRRNALSIGLLENLCDRIERMAGEQTARVLILRGAGPVFSAGLDLAEASQPNLVQRSAQCVARALQMMRDIPLVTIAAAHGGAYAGGAGLMAACDIAIGASDLKISFPEARRGLLPALICAVMKSKVRDGDLRELFLVGHTIDANRAQQIGLLQRVVEPAKLIEAALEIAQGVLAGGPHTIKATKMLLNETYPSSQSSSLQHAIDVHLGARRSPEATEGLAAFLEKRPPRWLSDETKA